MDELLGRLAGWRRFGRINELLDFCSFLVDFSQMLGAEALIHFEFCLGTIFLADMNIVLSQAVMGVRKIGIHFERLGVFRNGFCIFMLIGIEVTQLDVCFSKFGIKSH